MMRRQIIDAALGAYENACTFPHYTEEQRVAARSAVRDMMVRLDLYDAFLEAQDITPTKPAGTVKQRYRQCRICGHRFSTWEEIEDRELRGYETKSKEPDLFGENASETTG